jgi:hypothetical protein
MSTPIASTPKKGPVRFTADVNNNWPVDPNYDPEQKPTVRKTLRYIIACTSERSVPSATFGNSLRGKAATASSLWEAKDKAMKAKLPGAVGLPLLGVLNNDDAIVVVFGSSPIGPRNPAGKFDPTGKYGGKHRQKFKKSKKRVNPRKNKTRRLRRH